MTERVLADRYQLVRRVGHGGMAEVYEAHDQVLDRKVAVKQLLPHFQDDQQFVERFRREAQAAASLSHPNVVSVFDTGEQDGLPFIVMELVKGRSLAEAIAAGGLNEDRALDVCADVCEALQYAHDRGLIHRDVKPGNILLADGGSVKVTDFGIARAINAETVTQTAAVLGTAAYLSPEQAQGSDVDARSDVYSLGVVLYEVLTGHQPFQGESAVGVAYQHVQELPRPPRDVKSSVSPSAESIAIKAMAKNPSNRYASAAEMGADLLRARGGEAVTAPAVLRADETSILEAVGSNRPQRSAGDQRRRRVLIYTLLGLFSVAAAAAAVFFLASWLDSGGTEKAIVPNLTGMTLGDAQAVLAARGLGIQIGEEVFSEDVDDDHVAEQKPPPGSRVDPDTKVELSLSKGREQIEVPDVAGMEDGDAKRALRDLGLVPIDGDAEFSDEVAEGIILRTDPAAGEMIAKGSEITVIASSGEETVRVPLVVLDTEADAIFALEEAGLDALVVREFHQDVEEGKVIRQSPEPGDEVAKGSDVTIVVSKGPPDPEPEPTPSPSDTGSTSGPIIIIP